MSFTKRSFMRTLLGTAVVATFAGTAWAQQAQGPIKIGVLATLEGPFAAGGADGMRGAELAVRQRGGMVAGRKIELIKRRRTPNRTSRSTPRANSLSRIGSTSWSARCPAAKALQSRTIRRPSRR